MTGSLNTARDVPTSILLPSGQVLAAGGYGGGVALSSAELYDAASGNWTVTGVMSTVRADHTATLLTNGLVLVAGGYNGSWLSSAELYNPTNGQWTATGALNTARNSHTATLLPSGRVLVAGGYSDTGGALVSAELFDPATGLWTATGSLNQARSEHVALLLPSGKVLVIGGWNESVDLASCELYDPATDQWTLTGNMSAARVYHSANLLANGQVLVAGGQDNSDSTMASSELYDLVGGTWTTTGTMNIPRETHTATLLPNGQVLAAGGNDGTVVLAGAEIYNPAFNTTVTNYTIDVIASPTYGGTVGGGGSFTFGSSQTVTATANSGYTFANWTQNGSVVSSSTSYLFTLSSNMNLVAHFTANTITGPIVGWIQPTNHPVVVGAGSNVTFSVSVIGIGPFSYQWQRNGTNLPLGIISTVAGTGVGNFSGDRAAAINAALNYPQGVAVDTVGDLIVDDWGNNRVREVRADGIIVTLAGNGTYGYFGDGGAATNAELYKTNYVTVQVFSFNWEVV